MEISKIGYPWTECLWTPWTSKSMQNSTMYLGCWLKSLCIVYISWPISVIIYENDLLFNHTDNNKTKIFSQNHSSENPSPKPHNQINFYSLISISKKSKQAIVNFLQDTQRKIATKTI